MKLKHLFFLAVTGTLAVACSEVNENSLTDGDGQRMLRTISSGNDRFSTRLNSETSEWESGDAIGIYMFDTEDKNVLNDALNVKYTTIGEGLTVNFSSDPGIAIYDMPTNFVAYYPHATSADVIDATAALYKVDISDQSNGISAHDLMWAKAANQSTESLLAGGLAFTFHHQLVLLRVNITNENVSDVTSVTVGGMNTTATFNLIDGTLSNIGTQKSVALQKKDNKSFIGIMLPTEELKNKLSLTILADGGKYQYTVPETSKIDKFVAGNEYTFDITVGKETSGEVGGGSGSNTPWGDGGNEEGNGDKVSENEAIPADYAQKAITAETDLSTVLSGASGKAALVFAANADGYTFSDVMVVPEAVTELLLIGDPGFKGGDRTEIELPAIQREVLALLKKNGKKTVFVNFSGSAMAIVPETQSCDAILQAWYPGQAGGTAVADVLFGDYNPAGRLPITFYKSIQQLPDYEDYSMKGRTYRFMTETPLYPFGYGLSYTRFSYGKATLNQPKLNKGEKAILTIPVSNVGQRDGEEVVQVYICRPDDKGGPQKTLRGFQRVNIAKGKTQNVNIELPYDSFEWFDTATNTIRPLSGTYKILYGNSSNENDLQTCSIQIQ